MSPFVQCRRKVVAQTWPPLGQVTTYDNDKPQTLSLTAVLQICPLPTRGDCQEVAIWHSIDGAAWSETPLSPADPDADDHLRGPQLLGLASASASEKPLSLSFFVSPDIPFVNSLEFTLKFRLHGEQDWRWIRDENGLDNGHVLVLPPPPAFDGLEDVMSAMDSAWTVSNRLSQSRDTQLWSLKAAISPARGDEPAYQTIPIGSPWSSLRWFALVRTTDAWLAPRHGRSELFLDKDAVFLSFMNGRGQSLVLLPVCQANILPVLRHSQGGRGVSVHVQNDSEIEETVTILASVGNSLDHAMAAVMYEARDYGEHWPTTSTSLRPACEGPWYDGLGFCTWNALGQRLSEERILGALEELRRRGISISNLIIDDNWQSIDYQGPSQFQHRWMEFEAETPHFQGGLKSLVSKIKEQHPNIENVSVWHAIIGYWGGISPHGTISENYKTIKVLRKQGDNPGMNLAGEIMLVAKDDVLRLYQDFYQFLADAGIDGVKVDAQFMLDTLSDALDRRELIDAYLDAWSTASLQHFGCKTISCMSMTPSSLFHALLPRSRRLFQLRNSDDYLPDVPSAHPWHLWTNAHNAIFSRYLNVLPDWDMFQTNKMQFSAYHAAARCVSGGPIYITDVPGQHDMDLISQITARTTRGKTVVLRPEYPAMAMHCYTGYQDNQMLKVGTYSGGGTSIMALFNVSQKPLTELIHLSSFPGTIDRRLNVIRAHTTGRVSAPIQVSQPGALRSLDGPKEAPPMFTASLDVAGYEILCAFPVHSFRQSPARVANLGLLGKMTGAVAIVSSSAELHQNKTISIKTKLKALGVLGMYISVLPSLIIRDNFSVLLNDLMVPEETVSVAKEEPMVLEVDVEKAWRDMGLKPEGGDVFEVKILFPA